MNIKWNNIWVFGPLGPFGTLGPYLFSYLGPLWALLGPLALCDYERLWNSVLSGKAGSFLEKQEAFWKGRKLSGRSRKLSGKAGSFLVYHEASDGPFGPFGTLGPKKCPKIGTFFDQLFSKKSTSHKVLVPSHYAKKMRIWILSISTFHKKMTLLRPHN